MASNTVGFRSDPDANTVRASLFQLFTNGQRQFAQKVDIGSDPKTIFCSFCLRNPDAADNPAAIEPNFPARKNGGGSAGLVAGALRARMVPRFAACRARRVYRFVQTLMAASRALASFAQGRTIPDLSLRLPLFNVPTAFICMLRVKGAQRQMSNVKRQTSNAAQKRERPRSRCEPGPFSF